MANIAPTAAPPGTIGGGTAADCLLPAASCPPPAATAPAPAPRSLTRAGVRCPCCVHRAARHPAPRADLPPELAVSARRGETPPHPGAPGKPCPSQRGREVRAADPVRTRSGRRAAATTRKSCSFPYDPPAIRRDRWG